MGPSQNGDTANNPPFMIGVDWGTSSFRAYLMTSDGDLVDQVAQPLGILNVAENNFSQALDDACGSWQKRWPGIPIVMCGMIGSRQGWREVPYLSGAVGVSELADSLLVFSDQQREIRIVPGLKGLAFFGGPDVMRGEETILLGALLQGAPQTGLYCLPGTHSKWVEIANGKIGKFSTFLTGELYSMLCTRSILSGLIEENPGKPAADIDAAFLHGVELASRGGGVLHQLFAIRASVLTGELDGWATRSVLSGLLIGVEIASMSRLLDAAGKNAVILTTGEIGKNYAMALKSLGFFPSVLDAEEACRMGLYSIASRKTAMMDPNGEIDGKR